MLTLTDPIFTDEIKAREYLEAQRWPDGPICPHCGVVNEATRLEGKAHRPGLYQCNECRAQFSVTVGTLFERSHVPLTKWLAVAFLLNSSKKGMSSRQFARMLGVTVKTAWFMTHRVREAMREPGFPGPMGSQGGTVEADETFIGGKNENRHKSKRANPPKKEAVLALVERGGEVRSFHIKTVSGSTLRPLLRLHISQSAHLRTDADSALPKSKTRRDFASHETVNHSAKEYVRGGAHTNTVENYFSILKRGIYGVYHHVSGKHLKRYLAEFDRRYSTRKLTDAERTAIVLKAVGGRRLLYRASGSRQGRVQALHTA